MYNTIRFDHDKNGKKVAYYWMNRNRWVRMPMAEAEIIEATERQDTIIYYGPNCWKPGKFEFETLHTNGTFEQVRIVKVSD